MTCISVISRVLLVLLLSVCFVPGHLLAEQGKVTDSDGSAYVIQMGAFREQKTAQQMLSRLRSKGIEVFGARKDNGMYVVQSQSFATREMAHDLAVWLVTSKLIDNYYITATAEKAVPRRSGDHTALAALARDHLRNDRHEAAYRCFSELNRLEPEEADHVSGMIYALAGMKEFEKALELAPAVNSFFYKKLPVSHK